MIPVKPPGIGKTRLVGVPADQRVALATAFAVDTVAACLATPGVARVLVTTDDARFATTVIAMGAEACPDGGNGLNPALSRPSRRPPAGGRTCGRSRSARTCRPFDPAELAAALTSITVAAGLRRRCRRHRHDALRRAARRVRATVRCRLGGRARGGRRGARGRSARRAAAGRRRPGQPAGGSGARRRPGDAGRPRRFALGRRRRAALMMRTARRG